MNLPNQTGKKLRFVIIGSGMAGILAAIKLQEKGRHDVVIYEKADRIGGTWRENNYPGLTCDVPAHAYTYSFAPNPEWSAYFATGSEIQSYFESVVKRFNLEPLIQFNQEVTSCIYDGRYWQLETRSGLRDRADVVISATGVLHHPKIADIPGLETFSGPKMHSARWNHAIPLQGKRVAVIGSGSTGVQLVSGMAGVAQQVTHIVRSPQWIMPVPNDPYTEEQRAAFRANPKLIDGIRYDQEYLSRVRRFTDAISDKDSEQIHEIEALVLQNLEQSIADPVLREKLRPQYRAACKRLIYSSNYYAMVQRPDVSVVVGHIERIEPNGVRMKDGTLCEADILALATGFHADRFMRPMKLRGRNGADIDIFWSRNPSAYLGVTMPGFPNYFIFNGPTGPVGNMSLIDIAERQWAYMASLLEPIENGRCHAVDLKIEVMNDYNQRRLAAAKRTIFASGCQSWYLDNDGVPASWPWNYEAFAEQTAAARLEEYDLID